MLVARQPILEPRLRLCGDEFLFRGGDAENAVVRDDAAATGAVIRHVFLDVGMAEALGAYKGFSDADERPLASDVPHPPARDKIALEVLETVELSASVPEREIRREPGLALSLIRLGNSAAMGVPGRLESLCDASLLPGRRNASPLPPMAAARRRFMALLVSRAAA